MSMQKFTLLVARYTCTWKDHLKDTMAFWRISDERKVEKKKEKKKKWLPPNPLSQPVSGFFMQNHPIWIRIMIHQANHFLGLELLTGASPFLFSMPCFRDSNLLLKFKKKRKRTEKKREEQREKSIIVIAWTRQYASEVLVGFRNNKKCTSVDSQSNICSLTWKDWHFKQLTIGIWWQVGNYMKIMPLFCKMTGFGRLMQ